MNNFNLKRCIGYCRNVTEKSSNKSFLSEMTKYDDLNIKTIDGQMP